MSNVYLAQSALLVLGMAFAGYWAYQAFDKPPINLGDGPALPRYMTQPSQYRTGVIVFVGTCLLIYALIAYFHQQLVPIVGVISPELQEAILKSMNGGSLSYPLVVIFSAAIFVTLLKVEKDWNPIFVLRRVVHGWVSIPKIANALMVIIRDELIVPAEARAGVAGDPDTPYVTIGDFDKDRRSLDRRWAELCYIRRWLEHHRTQGSHFTFFSEPSFAWEQLQADYYNARDRVAPLKRGEVNDANIFADVAAKIEALRRQYCRLAACFLVFKNETQKDALRDAKQFGVIVTTDAPRANPLRYSPIIVVTIIIAVYLGVSISSMTWDLLHQTPVILESEIATRWMLYGLANYGMPIIAVLLLRYLGWRIDQSQPNSYLVSYATIFLVALCVGATCIGLVQMVLGQVAINEVGQFAKQVASNVKWSLSPAVVAIYMIYHVDRQIDPLLPDLGSVEHWRLPQRLMSCIFFGFLVAGFSLLPTLEIAVSRSAWPIEKLQLVILGTTFIVALIMAVVGEFLLIAPERASDDSRAITAPPSPKLKPWTRHLVVTASLMAVFVAGLAAWALSHGSVVPQWAFEKKAIYLGEKIPLTWTYKLPASSAPVLFEIESGVAGKFRSEWCTDADHHFVNRVNATREWRVRAVADCVSKSPVSNWSRSIEITQYDSIYQRIKARGKVDIFVSKSQDQDFFKWGNQGFDIDLANLIVRDLSSRMDRELKLVWQPVRWEKLLPAVADASADLAISTITKTAWREKKFAIQFSDVYYCTSYALVYPAGAQEGQILDMMKGKTVGVQRETTSSVLVNKLAAGGLFSVHAYDDNESLQNALVGSKIDFGVTDTAFARSAQLDIGEDRLKFKQFGPGDVASTEEEPIQEYAIAVHKGEIELLRAINQTLRKTKESGEMAVMFKTAAAKYEAYKNYQPGSRSLGPRPWECFGQTASGN
jgi:ABC-type amino acid transport substrate-binding protein